MKGHELCDRDCHILTTMHLFWLQQQRNCGEIVEGSDLVPWTKVNRFVVFDLLFLSSILYILGASGILEFSSVTLFL